MQQKTLIALGALGALAIAAWLTLRAPEKGQRIGPPPRPIAAFKTVDVKELDLASNGGKDHVVLKYEGGAWRLTQPAPHAADQQLVKTAVEQLEKTTFADVVTENTEKFKDLEVSDDKGAHVIARGEGGKVLFDAWLGKSSSGFTMLRPAGKNEVWQAANLFKYTYAKDPKQWRDHTILDFSRDDVSRLEVAAGAQKLVLDRIPPPDKTSEAKWKVVEASVKVDPLDDAAANGLTQTLATLKAAEFDDTSKPEDVGIAAPQVRITATVKGKPQTLLVGKQKGDDSWVALDGNAQLFLVQKYVLERLAIKPMNFRDKTLVKAKEADLTEVDVTVGADALVIKRDGDKWSAKGNLDDAKVKGLVGSFDNVVGTGFAETADPKVTGLAKPTGTVVLKLRDKAQVQLKIGAVSNGTDYFVQKVGSPDILLVKKYAIDRFFKKPADLAKAAPAAK
jgi:hypothetical protein